jgi:hypothetical protein
MNDGRGASGTDGRRPAAQRAAGKTSGKFTVSLAGMGAEILFASGLILIGFLISLLSGW